MRPSVAAAVIAGLAIGFTGAGHAAVSGKPLWTLTQTPEPTDFSQPGNNQPKYFTSPVAVEAGKTYTLVIEGDAHTTNANSSYSYDGVWQYDYQPSSAQPNPQRCCIDLQIAGHEGHADRPGDNPPQSVPFDRATHHYEIRYIPPFSGNLEVRDVMRYAEGFTTLTGKIEFELFGPGSGGGSKLPPLSSPTARPKLGVPTDYKVMALGAVGVFDGWAPRGGQYELDTEIHFIDAAGNYVASPPIAAIQDQASKAEALCYLFGLAVDAADSDAFGEASKRFSACADTVARILARADQLHKQGGARAHAAASHCLSLVRGTKRARPRLRITCTSTATGARISIRPRAKGKTLAQVMRGRAPKLVVARSSIPSGDPARLRVKWTAKKR